jgi:hypothetical protein
MIADWIADWLTADWLIADWLLLRGGVQFS